MIIILILVIVLVTCNKAHVHTIEKVAKVDATYAIDGTEAYYKCSTCDKIFADEEGTQEITLDQVKKIKYYSEGLEYVLSDDGTSYYVKGIGTCTDANLVIPSTHEGKSVTGISKDAFKEVASLISVVIPDTVTTIGDNVLYDCENLTSVTIGSSVTSIGDLALCECTSLVEIVNKSSSSIDKTEYYSNPGCYALNIKTSGSSDVVNKDGCLFYTYDGTNYLIKYVGNETSIVLPNDYNGETYKINDYFAYYNDKITSVTITNKVTSIGGHAFSGCTNLANIVISDSVTTIGDHAFWGCEKLTNVTIPDSVTTIADYAFQSCTNLTSLTIGNGITSISDSTFYRCKNLTNVVIPDSVTIINQYAFWGCEKLTSIVIPKSVTTIGLSAFEDCTNLTNVYYKGTSAECSVNISDRNDKFVSAAKYYYAETQPTDTSNKYWHYVNNEIEVWVIPSKGLAYTLSTDGNSYSVSGIGTCTDADIIIPSIYNGKSVTTIGESAFDGCTSLTSIDIPDSVTSIGGWAFYGCTSLTSIVIPDSVTTIGESAFDACTSLTNVTMGNSITSVGSHAFYECTSLTSIVIPDSATAIETNAFYKCTSLTSIVIPKSVTTIGSSAFEDCTRLTYVYYKGTSTEWSVNISDRNDKFVSATRYYYSETQPTESGNYWYYENNKLKEWPSQGLEYTLSDDGTSYYVKGIGTCTNRNIVVGAYYNGKPVIGLTDNFGTRAKNAVDSITLADGIKEIKHGGLSTLSEYCGGKNGIIINLPTSITKFYTGSFDMSNVVINYSGTKEQFNAIEKETDWNYGGHTVIIVHCTDGDL